MDGTNKRRMNDALDWMFEELWNTPKDKFEWNAILNKAKEMSSISVAKVDNTCDKQKTGQDN
jgi:hypothetical protein